MKVGFRADNDLDRDIVRGLLRLEPNTHDISTVPPLFFHLRGRRELPGVLLTPQSYPVGKAVEQLHLIWVLTDAIEWQNRICYLPTLADFTP